MDILFSRSSTAPVPCRPTRAIRGVFWAVMIAVGCAGAPVLAQSVSGVRAFGGGVAPLFNLTGPANLYVDNQGTQGYLYTPGSNFETFNFRNPTTGQAWSGAVMTFGPQLSIGLIQGANQSGTPIVLPGPPRQTAPLLPIQSTVFDATLLDDIP